jgi:hypothetical protein
MIRRGVGREGGREIEKERVREQVAAATEFPTAIKL